jgi:hypothetical protein
MLVLLVILLSLARIKSHTPKSLGGIYEQEYFKEAHNRPPKREMDCFGGSLN